MVFSFDISKKYLCDEYCYSVHNDLTRLVSYVQDKFFSFSELISKFELLEDEVKFVEFELTDYGTLSVSISHHNSLLLYIIHLNYSE